MGSNTVRVALAHEWLVSYAGSERCVEQFLVLYPEARLLTTVIEPAAVPEPLRRGEPSPWLQRLPGSRTRHEWFVPLMPLAWRTRAPLADVDVVISSSHACAKAVRVAPGIPHVCYCHTPMRYAWDFASEAARFPPFVRPVARLGMGGFRRWDRHTASRVTSFVANSAAVARRIERFYGRSAQVVHPPVDVEYFTPGGERNGTFLFVGRLVGYKRPELLLEAFRGLPERLVLVGDGGARAALEASAPPNVEFRRTVDAAMLRDLYRSATALIHPGVEDFGIGMAEAQACGTPVIAPAEGGATDIVEPGVTGWLVDRIDASSIREVVQRAVREELDAERISARAQRFSATRFREQIRDVVDAELARA